MVCGWGRLLVEVAYGYWILDAGYWVLDTGCWMLDAGWWKRMRKKLPIDFYFLADMRDFGGLFVAGLIIVVR